MSLLYMYSILRGFGGRGTGQHMQGQPVGGVKRRVGRNCPNQRNRRRVTITFEFFSSSRILFIVLYVHFIQIFQVLIYTRKSVMPKHVDLIRKSLAWDRTSRQLPQSLVTRRELQSVTLASFGL